MSPKYGMALFIGIFSLIGGTFFVLGLVFGIGTARFKAAASVADGVVTGLERHSDSDGTSYYPVFRFTPAGGSEIEAVGGTGSSPPAFKEGQKVKVLYDPKNPKGAKIDNFWDLWLLPGIFTLLGGIFLAVGVGMLISRMRESASDHEVHLFGKQIQAKVTGVVYDTSFSVNGQSPYRITAQWLNPDTNRLYVFRSDQIWFDPGEFIKGGEITVFVDPKNYKRYDVDISFLPKMA